MQRLSIITSEIRVYIQTNNLFCIDSTNMVRGQCNYAFKDTPIIEQDVKLEAFAPSNGQVASTDLTKDGDGSETLNTVQLRARRCWNIVIEPAMVLAFTFEISFIGLLSQYIYNAVGEKYNLTAVIEAEKGNMTGGGGGEGGSCRDDGQDKNSTVYDIQQRTQAESAIFILYIEVITGLPGFFFILFFGK